MHPTELQLAASNGSLVATDVENNLSSVIWFHATRIPTTTNYEDGLLPTTAMRTKLLSELERLAIGGGLCSKSQWQTNLSCLSSKDLSWKNSLEKFDDGPHGFLIREVIIDPGDINIYDYTQEPEYIRCLCSGFPDKLGGKLITAYRNNSRAAIIPFRSRHNLVGVLPCVIEYIRTKLAGGILHNGCNRGFSGEGVSVMADDVLSIEWLAT